jgi:hypothetical protein
MLYVHRYRLFGWFFVLLQKGRVGRNEDENIKEGR